MMILFSQKRYNTTIIIISVLVSTLMHLPEILSITHTHGNPELVASMTWYDVLSETAYTFMSVLLLFVIAIHLFKINDPYLRFTILRGVAMFLSVLLLSALFGKLFVFMHDQLGLPAIDSTLHHYYHPLRDCVLAMLVTGVCYFFNLLLHQEQLLNENKQLKTENLVIQYETLKNQLNPHMFFNSLNTLQALVREDSDKAIQYINELSNVLRSTMHDSDSKTTSLQSEIELAESYMYLLKMRYEDNIIFEINIDDCYLDYQLPPISLQLLIENAMKHNEISSRHKLTVTIESNEENYLCVHNVIHARRNSLSSNGIGLENLAKRYRILFQRDIEVSNSDNIFLVKLPLIKQAN